MSIYKRYNFFLIRVLISNIVELSNLNRIELNSILSRRTEPFEFFTKKHKNNQKIRKFRQNRINLIEFDSVRQTLKIREFHCITFWLFFQFFFIFVCFLSVLFFYKNIFLTSVKIQCRHSCFFAFFT
jgi:hypothetical protein